ncbi:similar to GAL4-like transcription factor [Paecilomyces variotii No. 5]|uniref:Similar to GAL4-like transcription factor n=1 Tax=Byssochlamys spectabilis (strain No. 5 / NBRC 109023) TaxID=1356009 RepID=V5FLZ2_BYSSN|nr:similar to GAL4-like transcription factor [Paecilomyces variotii No. 5]
MSSEEDSDLECDAASPSCSRCNEAGVPCVAPNASRQGTAPRSIVQFLEDQLANVDNVQREAYTTRAEHLDDRAVDATQDTRLLINHVMKDFAPSYAGLTALTPLVHCAVTGTRLPSTSLSGAINSNEHHQNSTIDSVSDGIRLSYIPTAIADFLFENYLKRVVAQNPIFYLPDVVGFFNAVFHHPIDSLEPGTLASPYETYVVSLIMAVSLTTSARTQQLRANSIATGLFKSAMRYIQTVFTNDLRGLQALLLLCEYTFLNPSVANVWFLSGFTTQLCIDLGIHQETLDDQKADPLTVDIRRRVFWCAYEMEIATAGALLRPTQFLSKNINVPFPSEIEDTAISAKGVDPHGKLTKFPSTRIWRFRQIEAEVVSVLFHNGDLSAEDNGALSMWMERMEIAIDTWRDEVKWFSSLNGSHPASEEMCLYADIAHDYIIVTLFRPSTRVKDPTTGNLMKAFIAGVHVARGYWKQANLEFGSSKYVFHPCYHTFSAAVVFLQVLDRCKEAIWLKYSTDEIEDFISSFSKFFATIAERWPAASRCLEEFERLMAPVKRNYIDFTLRKARTVPNGSITNASFSDQGGFLLNASAHQDELVDIHTLFPQDVFSHGQLGDLTFTIPTDWEMEFDFGVI